MDWRSALARWRPACAPPDQSYLSRANGDILVVPTFPWCVQNCLRIPFFLSARSRSCLFGRIFFRHEVFWKPLPVQDVVLDTLWTGQICHAFLSPLVIIPPITPTVLVPLAMSSCGCGEFFFYCAKQVCHSVPLGVLYVTRKFVLFSGVMSKVEVCDTQKS